MFHLQHRDWYLNIGIALREGYGMTENFVDGCFMYGDDPRPGSVGKPISGVEVKIDENDEICFKSPALMKGYYLEPEKTAEVLVDGWYHSGDAGRFDDNGNVCITGRLSQTFKSSKGKFIQPQKLESKLS